MINSNTHPQIRTWERGQIPVGGDCYHTIYLNCKTDFFFMLIIGAMAIVPYPPVGWGTPKALPLVVLTPTKTKTTNKLNSSNKNQYANVCRDRDIPTYGYFEGFWRNFDFRPTLLNGAIAIAPYGFLLNLKHYNLTYLSQKLFFNVKIVKNLKKAVYL